MTDKYKVSVAVFGSAELTIEARSPEEAFEIASMEGGWEIGDWSTNDDPLTGGWLEIEKADSDD